MSVEKAKEFLLSLQEKAPDEAFIEKWKSAESEDERMQLYVELAGSMGYDLPVTEIKEALTGLDDEHKAKTLAAKKEMEALEDDELEQVAGGFYYYKQDGMGIWCELPFHCGGDAQPEILPTGS